MDMSESLPGPSAAWRDKLGLLLESTGEGMFGVDLSGRCTFINRAAAAMLGMSVQQALGRNMHELVHHTHADGRHYPEEDCPILRAYRAGRPCRIDQEVFWRADGTPFAVEYQSHAIVDAGQIRGAVVSFNDISRRREAEEKARLATLELERRVAERTAELSSALEQLRQLGAHAHVVREEERKRIAREIHDELGSLLVALKLDLNWLGRRLPQEEQLARKCLAMRGLIDNAVENVGRIITDLRPSLLDHQGLVPALEWQLQEFGENSEMECLSSIVVAPEATAPNPELATAAFRIFQEMLSNVARHARASKVEVRIEMGAEQLCMTVTDNGRGVRQEELAAPNAWGIMGMRERARHFGGSLSIAAEPQGGTVAHLALPLAGKEAKT